MKVPLTDVNSRKQQYVQVHVQQVQVQEHCHIYTTLTLLPTSLMIWMTLLTSENKELSLNRCNYSARAVAVDWLTISISHKSNGKPEAKQAWRGPRSMRRRNTDQHYMPKHCMMVLETNEQTVHH